MMKKCKACDNMLSGRQKVYCSIKCQAKGRSHTLQDCQKIAQKLGGQCLSTQYVNNNTYMDWRCHQKHEWKIPFGNILDGTWCEQCVRTKWTTEMMQSYIKNLGGKCNDSYTTMKTLIIAECPEGHNCKSNFDNIIHKNRIPCRICRSIKNGNIHRKWTEGKVRLFIELKGGSVISKFTRVDKPFTIQCGHNHAPWTTTFDSIHNAGTWCPLCANNAPVSLQDVEFLAKQKGFTLLSKAYIRSSDKLKFKCPDGHIFYIRWSQLKRGTGCTFCYSGTKESKCRFIFEECFDAKFPQTRKALGNHYQLDGYNELLKMAFEYQGEQHYTPAWYHKKNMSNFYKLQKIDQEKRKLCVDKKITCIEIPYWQAKTDEQLIRFLHKEFNRLEMVPNMTPLDVEMNKFPGKPSKLQEIRNILEEAGSKLISGTYVDMKSKTLEIQCKCGYSQKSAPQNILYAAKQNQGWCRSCGNKKIARKRREYWQRRGRYDYDKIKAIYVAGGITMQKIADKFGCSITTVHKSVHF